MVYFETDCIDFKEDIYGRGLFSGNKKFNPFNAIYPVSMVQAILALFMCKLVYYALRPWIKSRVVCNFLGGIILGASVLGKNKKYMENIFPDKEMLVLDTIVKIGTGYFIFLTAVKMDAAMFLKMAKNIWIISLSSCLMPLSFALVVCLMVKRRISELFGRAASNIHILCHGLSVTLFSSIADAMDEHNLLTTELGQLAMSTVMLIEAIGWSLMCFSIIFTQENIYSSIGTSLSICLLAVFAAYIVRPAILQIIKRTPEESSVSEISVVAVLILVLVMGFIADSMIGGFQLGVLLMGLIIPDGPPLGAAIVEKTETMVMEFFQPLFFLLIGYNIDASLIFNYNGFGFLLLLVVGVQIGKISGILLASLFVHINFRNADLLGFILNFKGVINLAAMERWLINGLADERMYTALKPEIRLIESPCPQKYRRTLQTTPFAEEFHILTCIHGEDNVHSIITLLEASNPTVNSPLSIHAIELSGRAAPLLTPYSGHSKSFKSNNSTYHIMHAFSNYSRNSHGPVLLRPFVLVAPFKTMHNIICNYAEDRRVPFIIVPFLGNQQDNNRHLLRSFNAQLQANAPCTVGILVQKGLPPRKNLLGQFSCNVLVIFMGGPDDSEALKLAMRMSENSNVSITLLRIYLKMDEVDIKGDGNGLDDLLVQEFKDKNVKNSRVLCHEVVVNDSLQLIATIQSMEHSYDLVVVGKVPAQIKFLKEMTEWAEYSELGVMGDFLYSSKFHDCKMSMLMQHYLKVEETTPSFFIDNA
ncbi:cation/H(+) antiporter 15-like [Hevea brasiliensis]|uniref:cation/H(+) antiporter 15-like n=1 Tax=Hevea brasiliensis TaxID=3981 RepID=UPI0025DC072B|nr:cation/H(+) antiporter 15-like [Hevea brasiliensis]